MSHVEDFVIFKAAVFSIGTGITHGSGLGNVEGEKERVGNGSA